ncbi:hypothetical protein GOALK_016_01370 [Gordonia alkanivorans NBRC 16433]|uniref:Uncharacterized protein n=1 Tax=Gordonia alkanivorans NBRC 16433 TaxID=1027371 RepID=F9VQX5_9ACTN|nr:hypothetical protein GOALK_016_01370 [Gordonia alkanivorans NBRC 16433]
MTHLLEHWFDSVLSSGPGGYFSNTETIRELASFMRTSVPAGWDAHDVAAGLLKLGRANGDYFLDLIDGLLQLRGSETNGRALARLLETSGSVWTVADDNRSLIRVVSDQTQSTYEIATSPEDDASEELREAWTNAFGRDGDPSDAWDHAIKAVEDVLIPAVVPNQAKANLGHVVGQLRNQGNQWKLVLPGKAQDHDVSPLVGMLDVIWPNHDRHGGVSSKRQPSEEEARAVVTLASTIVQWHREGWVVQRR